MWEANIGGHRPPYPYLHSPSMYQTAGCLVSETSVHFASVAGRRACPYKSSCRRGCGGIRLLSRSGFPRIFPLSSRLMAPGPHHGGHIAEPGITADLSAIQDYSIRGFFKRTIRAVNADGVIPGTRDACPSEPGRTINNLSVSSRERPGIPL